MMNKRILKLAKKSGATVNEGFDGTKNFVYGITMSPEELEKFAESIVRGCVTRLEQHHPFTKDPEAYLYAISLIEEHFGVEE